MTPYDLVLSRIPNPIRVHDGFAKFCCPCHDDSTPSATVRAGDDGAVLLGCFGCGATAADMVKELGLEMSDLFVQRDSTPRRTATMPAARRSSHGFASADLAMQVYQSKLGSPFKVWEYHDASGKHVASMGRFNQPDGSKEFRPVSLSDDGKWYCKGPDLRPLYCLPALLKSDDVIVTEGEKAADELRTLGFAVTTSMNGSKSPAKTDWTPCAGRNVTIWIDHDEPGIGYGNAVASILLKLDPPARVKIIDPGTSKGDDAYDWIHSRGDAADPDSMRAEVESMIAAARDFVPPVEQREKPSGPNEAGNDPHRLARLFVKQIYTMHNGLCRLVWWQGSYWAWDGLRWRELKKHEFIAALTACIKAEFDRINIWQLENWTPKKENELPPEVWPVTKGLLTNVDNAVASIVVLADHVTMPDWLCGDPAFPAREVLATTKTLLHLPSLIEGKTAGIQPTPMLFSANCLTYDYDPRATCPNFLQFVNSIWEGDIDSIAALQEWFGYLLLPDTRQHKLLMLIGPPRSGKGTITRVLQLLLGEGNVASPTLSSLAGPFGLWPMLNKFVALIPDARLSGRDDAVAVVERMLSITGEDPQDIHRKNLPTLTGIRMPIRFVLMSNELPNMRDASGAFMTRVVLLRMTKSFVGCEDRGLGERLAKELPGILNWAIEGWKRLNERGHFVQPASADELLNDLENLSSPIRQFIADACVTGPGYEASIGTLYSAWTAWCEQNHRDHKGTNASFGKDLRAALPHLTVVQRRDGGQRDRCYSGIGVKVDW